MLFSSSVRFDQRRRRSTCLDQSKARGGSHISLGRYEYTNNAMLSSRSTEFFLANPPQTGLSKGVRGATSRFPLTEWNNKTRRREYHDHIKMSIQLYSIPTSVVCFTHSESQDHHHLFGLAATCFLIYFQNLLLIRQSAGRDSLLTVTIGSGYFRCLSPRWAGAWDTNIFHLTTGRPDVWIPASCYM